MKTRLMQFQIDDNIEWTAKLLAALTAIWAFLWKIGCPCWRWIRAQIAVGSKVDALHAMLTRELKPNGTPICEKVTEIQSSLRVLTLRWRLQFENSGIPSYECDKEGNCIAVNPAWCKLFGVTEHHMLGNGWLDVIEAGPERDRVMDNWRESVTNRLPHRERYKGVNRQTGETIFCESSTVSFSDHYGVPIMYFGTITIKGENWKDL